MNRRGFLKGVLATGIAPAVIGSGILMPVRAIAMPQFWPASTLGRGICTNPVARMDQYEYLNGVLVPNGTGLRSALEAAFADVDFATLRLYNNV